MIKNRRSVFETNSSSSHSISIRKEGSYVTAEELEKMFKYKVGSDGEYTFFDFELEFERSPFSVLTTFENKLRFAVASFGYDKEKREEIEAIMYEFIPGLQTIKYPTRLNWETSEEEPYYGYIDHQSMGVLQVFLRENKISLKEFLTNSKYVVWIDGDEYLVKENLIDSGLIHKEDFEEL